MNKPLVVGSLLFVFILIFVLFSIFYPQGLTQSFFFYKKRRDSMIKYLSAVYPMGNFNKYSTIKLAKFYNSLWMFYNCAGSLKNDKFCWDQLPDCGTDKLPKLPFVPQGKLYNVKSWLEKRTPIIKTDSVESVEDIISLIPGVAWHEEPFGGPGPMWMSQRVIYRYVYHNKLVSDNGYLVVQSPPKPHFNHPTKWWNGVEDNGFIEVTGNAEPGDPRSACVVWLNGWPGSGVFYNVGKTFIANNKSDACFKLATELSIVPGGKDKLVTFFGSSDPYQIVRNLLQGQPESSYQSCNVTNGSPVNSRGWTLLNSDGNKIICNLCNLNFQQAVSYPNSSAGWHDVKTIYAGDWRQWCDDSSFPNSCIDQLRNADTYNNIRMNDVEMFDEPNFLMGLNLGYDSIQLTMSSNGNGFWQYEIMDLRNYPASAKDRDYSVFLKINSPNCDDPSKIASDNNVTFIDSWIEDFMNQKVSKLFTMKDPMDMSKAGMSCTLPTFSKGISINYVCDENMSKMYKNLQVVGCKVKCGTYDC